MQVFAKPSGTRKKALCFARLNSVRAACDRLAGGGGCVFSTCCFQFIYLYFVLINGTENGIKMTEKNDELILTKI